MKKHLGLIVIAMIAVFASGAYALDNIINIHINDVNGVPVAPYAVGTPVEIRGVVTAEFTNGTNTYIRAFVQDATGGINIYKSGLTAGCYLQVGNDVTVAGTIGQYNGLTQVMITSYTIHSSGNPLPAPLQITADDHVATFRPDYTEPNEGRLIKIKGVKIIGTGYTGWPLWKSTTYSINDSLNTGSSTKTLLYVYGGSGCAVHPLINTNTPAGGFDVIGILTQFDSTSPYTAGYQISPRGPADIIVPPTDALPSSWGRVKAMYK
ncbi:MAG: DUF5689 domain-containing protein [Candidatus Eisenbacteria bacterium]|nr:DUF5689 domain-containing protein [Candidatus Eisenbacteria bacterium]